MSDSESNEDETKLREGRTRNLLKNFYGIGDESSPGTDATSNLNTALFDANSYYKRLLRSEPLVELIQTDNKLVNDIRRLDSDMKTLVYENYSKFITATETIRKMRGNVETMEEEMNRLSTNMSQINNLTNNINDTLDFRRNQISKLSGVNHVITKFQFIIDLPLRLKKAIELDAYSQAVKYYKSTFPLLQKYQSLISSFKTISNETTNVIESLKKKLQNRIINSGESLQDVTESVQLLIELGDSAEDLRNQYLDLQNVKLQQKLEVAKKPNMSLTEMNKIFLDGFLEVALSYNRLFIEPYQDERSVSQLEYFASSLFAKYFDFLTLQLSSNFNMNELFVQVENLYDSIDSIDTKLPTLNLSDKSEQILVNVVNKQYELLFQQYYQSVKDVIFHLEDPSHDQYYNSLITERATNILVGLQDVLEKCKGTILSGNKFIVKHKLEIIQLIITKSHHLLTFINKIVQELLQNEVNKQSGLFLLLFAKLCLYIEAEGFKQLQSVINKFVSSVDNHTSHWSTTIIFEIAAPFKNTPMDLVNLYIRTESEKLSATLWKDREITDWWNVQEPSAPRSCIVNTVKTIYKLAGELNKLFEAPTQKSVRKSVSTLRSSPSMGSIFGRKFKLVADMELTSTTILHSVVKMYLKSLLENVRPHTYNVNGFRLLQVDTYLIRVALASLLESSQELSVSLHDLLDEVFHSVSERCVDPDTLDPEKLAKICESALATIKS